MKSAPNKAREEFLNEVLQGLTGPGPKRISPKYFYDQRGSELFELITELAEYYPTRAEERILLSHGEELADALGTDQPLLEWGSGAASKTLRLLKYYPAEFTFIPVDISRDALEQSARRLRADFPRARILPLLADYTSEMDLGSLVGMDPSRGVSALFLGSTIGNFDPFDAEAFLWRNRSILGQRGRLLVGFDLVKDRGVLEAAYDDKQGITSEFNRNLIHRMNRELGTDLDPESFIHHAYFNERESRIEMHLVSARRQSFELHGKPVHFAAGESIHTESSYKFTLDGFARLAAHGGWRIQRHWIDPDGLFAVALLT